MQELEKILEEIKNELKDIYLDIANNYNISDLQYDGDKVACVASKFRCDAGRRIEKIIRKRMNDGWIPVEERLPEEGGTYIITAKDGKREIISFAKWQNRYKHFDMTGKRAYWRVIAWCPLPGPYHPERNENDQ